ncbi:Hsp20/alpha crystallin family protein [Bacillus sp. FJAT-27445]|uniref:Hsp20/alpha crystallin family protein n=1 Tax=Bacillus sp. FJAT-27445 TaxID=1679166 RepID=UPI0007437D5F|nr:Hsp20/alpha crystallin family protein [Bacillus sp. FJAT-27445]
MFPWGSFPFNKDMSSMMKDMKPDSIEKYVREAIEAYLPKGSVDSFQVSDEAQSRHVPHAQAQVFLTHDYVYARIPISEDSMESIRLFHTSNQLFIENIPEQGQKQAYELPAVVKKKGATASVRDGILEIKLIRAFDVQMSEINLM